MKAIISLLNSDVHYGAPMSLNMPLFPEEALSDLSAPPTATCDALKTLEGYEDMIFNAIIWVLTHGTVLHRTGNASSGCCSRLLSIYERNLI